MTQPQTVTPGDVRPSHRGGGIPAGVVRGLGTGPANYRDAGLTRCHGGERLGARDRHRGPRDSPVDLVVHPTFDVARNLLLYAWLERSFVRPAELHAFACLEMGLRYHVNGLDHVLKGRSSLRTLLKRAVEKGSLHDQCIRPYPRLTGFGRAWSREYGTQLPEPGSEDTTRDYVDVLCDAIPTVRNRFAHGHAGWAQTAFATLSACRDLLNCLGPFQAARSELSETG